MSLYEPIKFVWDSILYRSKAFHKSDYCQKKEIYQYNTTQTNWKQITSQWPALDFFLNLVIEGIIDIQH